jgi:hypothetical protein
MDINGNVLVSQYRRAVAQYPFLITVEKKYKLPTFLLFAVGSRETNLTNEVGDYGHGHGMFQLDNRSHSIPAGFDQNVNAQAEKAGSMLADFISFWGSDLKAAVSSYNCGTGGARNGINDYGNSDANTAGGNYGDDVLGRRAYLLHALGSYIPTPPHPHPKRRQRFYTVQNGDNLTSIGAKFGMSWDRLYNANRETIGNNPNVIFVGETFVIPGRFI